MIGKKIILRLFGQINRLSSKNRVKLIKLIIKLSVSKVDSSDSLKILFELENYIYSLLGQESVSYGSGIHTKHRHIKYHDFFINNIHEGENVIDIGCGNGLMDFEIVSQINNVKLLGIDLNEKNIKFARERYKHPNLSFIIGDALNEIPNQSFDVVILSNVLEHIQNRNVFLKKIIQQIKPTRMIIRVPSFERDWRVPLKKELGIDYRLDPTHYIEYTQDEFFNELQESNLEATKIEYRWGEIWSVVEPKSKGSISD